MNMETTPRTPSVATPPNNLEPSGGSRLLALFETAALVTIFFFGIKALVLTPFPFWQYNLVGWDFNAHLVMIAMPMLLIYLRRERPSAYGMQPGQLSEQATRRLALAVLVALPLARVATMVAGVGWFGARVDLNLPPDWELNAWFASEPANTAMGVVLTCMFTMVSCGLGEEIMFRGYVQGRLNQVFGRPWELLGTRFGWGLFLAAFLFGFGHGLGFFNPFGQSFGTSDAFNFAWKETFATAGTGLVFGWLRERTGGIFAPAIIHAAVGLVFGVVVLK